MLDFTSALYLGMCHASSSLRPWPQLTRGVPAALATPSISTRVAREVAALLGCEQAVLSPSTLHLFFDLFGLLPASKVIIYMDNGIYPIGRWGVERAAGRGAVVRVFPHNDADALLRLLKRDAHQRKRPVIVTDGWCPTSGQFAPAADYFDLAAKFGGRLIIDDTQALGIFGQAPSLVAPYGHGGGGILRWYGIAGPQVLIISSMSKGFGAPIAALAGSEHTVRWFKEHSDTLQHCSPPSLAGVHAAEQALSLNHRYGETLRLHLAGLVRHFRNRLARAGFCASGGILGDILGDIFPFQTLSPAASSSIHRGRQPRRLTYHAYIHAQDLHQQLLRLGIKTVLRQGRQQGEGGRISFLITARHSFQDIDRAVEAIQKPSASIHRPVASGQGLEVREERLGAFGG